jgi:hypothetical protein
MPRHIKPVLLAAITETIVAWGCGGTIGAARSDRGPADDATLRDGPEDAVHSDGGTPGCVTPLKVQVLPGTGEAYFAISADGTQCSVHPGQGTDASLMYRIGPAGDFPTGEIWIPSGSPWRIESVDGSALPLGGIDTLQCTVPGPVPRYPLRLVDGNGDQLSMSVGCDASGDDFVVFGASFTRGGSLVDATAG